MFSDRRWVVGHQINVRSQGQKSHTTAGELVDGSYHPHHASLGAGLRLWSVEDLLHRPPHIGFNGHAKLIVWRESRQ